MLKSYKWTGGFPGDPILRAPAVLIKFEFISNKDKVRASAAQPQLDFNWFFPLLANKSCNDSSFVLGLTKLCQHSCESELKWQVVQFDLWAPCNCPFSVAL